MDLSFWRQLNPKIVCEPAKKQFYGKYLYRLDIFAAGGRVLKKELPCDYPTLISIRIMYSKRTDSRALLALVDYTLLESIYNIKQNVSNVKLSIREPSIQFYTESESDLQKIAKLLNHSSGNFDYLSRIVYPTDGVTAKLLLEGKLLVSSKIKYKYKVLINDGKYSEITKEQIKNYFDSLGTDELQYSGNTKRYLSDAYFYSVGSFFYINDLSIITFLSLIAPTAVGKIYELVISK